jgi:hypothetical protein
VEADTMSGCSKRAFASRAEAREHVRHTAKTARSYDGSAGNSRKLRPYLCPLCGLWHLTSQTEAERRRIQRKLGLR